MLAELDSLNMVIQNRVEPWALYSVNLDAVRDELALTSDIKTITWVSLGLNVLKVLLTLLVTICNALLVRD